MEGYTPLERLFPPLFDSSIFFLSCTEFIELYFQCQMIFLIAVASIACYKLHIQSDLVLLESRCTGHSTNTHTTTKLMGYEAYFELFPPFFPFEVELI